LAALKTLVIWLAVLFHVLFALSIIALGAFAFAAGPRELRLEMLPWSGATGAAILLGGGLFGLLSLVLAVKDRLRFLFFLWSLAVAILLLKGLFFSPYRFPPGEWRRGLYLVAAAWFTVLGTWLLMRAKPSPGPRKYRGS
jgi:hypothetical protein